MVELQKYEPDKTHKLDLRLKDKKGEDVGQIELVISVTGMQNDYLNSQPVSNGVSTSTSYGVVFLHVSRNKTKFLNPKVA